LRTANLCALPWTPLRLGGVGTNPECAVNSTDKFLASLSRIQIEILDPPWLHRLCAESLRLFGKYRVATVSVSLTVGSFKPAKAHGWESTNRGYRLGWPRGCEAAKGERRGKRRRYL
jgi:hypothetical protein